MMRGYLLPVVFLLFISLCRGTKQALIPRAPPSILPTDLAAAFQNATWIWTPEASPLEAPAGPRAFRRTFSTPSGRTATNALILIAVDNFFSLYVDGVLHETGIASTAEQWKTPMLFSVPLTSSSTLFGVLGVNQNDTSTGFGAAGLLAAVKIIFDDGTSTIFTSDSTWLASKTIPDGWEKPSSNEAWDPASVLVRYGMGPWGTNLLLPNSFTPVDPSNKLPNDLAAAFLGGFWIWTPEASPPAAPPGPRAFRKTYIPPIGKTPKSAMILIAVDNYFSVFVDGAQQYFGSSSSHWQNSILLNVPLTSPSPLFAVLGVNLDDSPGGGGPAGLLAAVKIAFTDGTSSIFTSDSSWIAAKTFSDGWQQPSTSETWDPANVILPYGQGPWATNVVLATTLAINNSSGSITTTASAAPSSSSTVAPSLTTSSSKVSTGTSSPASSSTESFVAPNTNAAASSSPRLRLRALTGVVFSYAVFVL